MPPINLKEIAETAEKFSAKIDKIEQQMYRMQQLDSFLDTTKSDLVVAVAPGVYYDTARDVYLVNVGKHIVVEKNAAEVRAYLQGQQELHAEYHDKLTTQLMRLLEHVEAQQGTSSASHETKPDPFVKSDSSLSRGDNV